ncbi:hypothetical protein TrLO_g1651 [Triparma laevis f. longispina]|uniref:Uncharacterized protein n=1 Tax=Triparma laevis f. longispina TaxID=1714387 RepID=A0A9W7ABW8_9STRA|nr:hypothetical protein TrLO_g1651 [Triparma laevis f. longispina]
MSDLSSPSFPPDPTDDEFENLEFNAEPDSLSPRPSLDLSSDPPFTSSFSVTDPLHTNPPSNTIPTPLPSNSITPSDVMDLKELFQSATLSTSPSLSKNTPTPIGFIAPPSSPLKTSHIKQPPPYASLTQQINPLNYLSPLDFNFLSVLGFGAFGKVLLCESKISKKKYAMKIISKRLVKKNASVEDVLSEKNILLKLNHPFIIQIRASFQTSTKLFIVMDLAPGGELFHHLSLQGLLLEKDAAFYIASITLALEFLHKKNIVHRDLKPENVLLSETGNVLLTDFGLASEYNSSTPLLTVCGTNEYMAPEMLGRKGYERGVDWWSLGVLVFEMCSGETPFRMEKGEGGKELNKKIMYGKIRMPPGTGPACCILLKGLLNRNVNERLGCRKGTMFKTGGVREIKELEFFEGIEWNRLERLEVEPPIIPTSDVASNFHKEFTDTPLPRSVTDLPSTWKPSKVRSDKFKGFSVVLDSSIVPERVEGEVEDYWNRECEEGESESDASETEMTQKVNKEKPKKQRKNKKQREREWKEKLEREEEEKKAREEKETENQNKIEEEENSLPHPPLKPSMSPTSASTSQPMHIPNNIDENSIFRRQQTPLHEHKNTTADASLPLHANPSSSLSNSGSLSSSYSGPLPDRPRTKTFAPNPVEAKPAAKGVWRPARGGWADRAKQGNAPNPSTSLRPAAKIWTPNAPTDIPLAPSLPPSKTPTPWTNGKTLLSRQPEVTPPPKPQTTAMAWPTFSNVPEPPPTSPRLAPSTAPPANSWATRLKSPQQEQHQTTTTNQPKPSMPWKKA